MISLDCRAKPPSEPFRSCTFVDGRAKEGARRLKRAVSSAVEHWFYTPLVGSSILSPPTSLRSPASPWHSSLRSPRGGIIPVPFTDRRLAHQLSRAIAFLLAQEHMPPRPFVSDDC